MDSAVEASLSYSSLKLIVGQEDAALMVMCYDVFVYIDVIKLDLLDGSVQPSEAHTRLTYLLDLID
jgi:hypothetical protein